jgi:cephalosporin-C deacetylase-like acetyl esterase
MIKSELVKTNKTPFKLTSHTFVTAVLAAWLACAATRSLAQVVLTPKHSDGLYQAGEKAVWTVKPASDSKATNATYSVRKNGVTQIQQGTLRLSSGSATIEVGLDEPGELVLNVTPPTESETNSAMGTTNAPENAARAPGRGGIGAFGRGQTRDGAIVDAGHLKPALPRPDDFDAWWEKKLAALDTIPANPQLEQTNVDIAGIEYYKVTLDNIHGAHVHGQLARPAKEGKFPAILQLQYAGVYPLQRAWVTDRAKAGWLALNVLAHDMPIDDQEEIRRLARAGLNNYQAIGNTNRETSYFLRMYLGDCQALKYLVGRPDWDGKTLVVMGDSMGGQQSFATVGLVGEKLKVTAMIVHVPSGADVGARTKGRTMAYPNWPDRPEVMETARYFDSVNFAPRIKAASLVSFGLFDGTSPPTGVISAFNLISGPKELLPLHSDHGGPGQQPRIVRRDEWLSALVKGDPAPVKNGL